MAVETTRTIGGTLFTVSPLDYEATCDLQPLLAPALADFMRLYAVFMGEAVKLQDKGEAIADMDVAAAFGALLPDLAPALAQASDLIASIAAKIPPDRMRTIRRTLLAGSLMDGRPLYATVEGGANMIGLLMRGRTVDGWKLLLFALEVNYPDFFGIARSFGAGGATAPPGSPSTTATPSAGPAGGS